jgi:replicative DNA helicase
MESAQNRIINHTVLKTKPDCYNSAGSKDNHLQNNYNISDRKNFSSLQIIPTISIEYNPILRDKRAEQAIIGAVLILNTAPSNLKPQEFYRLEHRVIWKIFFDLQNDKREVNYASVEAEIKSRNVKMRSKGYLIECIEWAISESIKSGQSIDFNDLTLRIRNLNFQRLKIETINKIVNCATVGNILAVDKIAQSFILEVKNVSD